MTTGKQHYVFNFRNPGDDPPITDWSVLFAENSIKHKAKSTDLSDVILKAEKSTKSNNSKSNDEHKALNRFFSIIEIILNI